MGLFKKNPTKKKDPSSLFKKTKVKTSSFKKKIDRANSLLSETVLLKPRAINS